MTDKKKPDYKKFIKNLSKNYWAIATIVLGVILVTILFTGTGDGATISGNVVGQKVLDFANNQGAEATLVEVNDNGQFYEVILSIQGQELPVYATKDGESFTQQLIPLTGAVAQEAPTQTSTPTDIPKSDKPKAELYIFSYCPAGTAALNTFTKAAKILDSVVDLKVKFFSNMHGEYEKQQNIIQECIQEVARDKYWDYAEKFVSDIYPVCGSSRDIGCDKTESIKLMDSLGINSDSVMTCVSQKGEELYGQDQSDAAKFRLSASPSIVVNDISLGSNFDRSSEGIKNIICSTFNEAPAECSEELATTTAQASGSC